MKRNKNILLILILLLLSALPFILHFMHIPGQRLDAQTLRPLTTGGEDTENGLTLQFIPSAPTTNP